MKTCKFKLPNNHIGVAEVDGNDVVLYIENNRRVFFNLIPWEDRVTRFEVFTLSTKDYEIGVEEQRFIHGYLSRYPVRYRNIDTFNIKAELERMYETYATENKRRDAWEKRLNNFI